MKSKKKKKSIITTEDIAMIILFGILNGFLGGGVVSVFLIPIFKGFVNQDVLASYIIPMIVIIFIMIVVMIAVAERLVRKPILTLVFILAVGFMIQAEVLGKWY